MKQSLMVFGKVPRPGHVKTRLIPMLTAESAAELYRCMLQDTIGKAVSLANLLDVMMFHEAGEGAGAYFREAARGMDIKEQQGKDLGERMAHAFDVAFAKGAAAAVLIGTDIPHLPAAVLVRAFGDLQDGDTDVVFGPAGDGGYYLVGMKRLHRELFTDIPWSTGTVLAKSTEIASAQGLRVALLPLLHDVDTPEDLLRPDLVDEGNEAPLTRHFLRDLLRCRSSFCLDSATSAPRSRTRRCPGSR